MCAHAVHASAAQESARFYCQAKRSLVKSEGHFSEGRSGGQPPHDFV